MHTSLQRRQRHRRAGAARRGRGGGAARRAALAIPLLLFSSFLVLGAVGFVATVSAYAYYSRDLPDPKDMFAGLTFEQPSIIYDRTGDVELARFGVLKRELAKFDQIPPEMVDATTAIEDKDFWTNPGFDVGAVISAGLDTISGRPRGASTITQQLVRARLLPEDAFEGSVYDRKIREIIQSIRLTQTYPGEDGKRQIMEAYLNQNFYGNQSYGVIAAAFGYWGKDLSDLSLAEYAALAAIPQSPSKHDLMRNAVRECTVEVAEGEECPADKVTLVVPLTTEIVERRNRVLEFMKTRSVLSGKDHALEEYEAAKSEPLILTPPAAPPRKAPHFVWQVRHQMGVILCGEEAAETCAKVDTEGYQVTTTLDWSMQQVVEKWLYAAARAPLAKNVTETKRILKGLGISEANSTWIVQLRGKDVHNAAGAVIDYRTGEVLATGGSAGYYLNVRDKKFSPQYDVMFDGFRQPGSAIKPIGYVTGLDDRVLTASTVFMDVVTQLAKGWTPADADLLERGPVRMRGALQFSLNIPAIKSTLIVGLEHLFERYKAFGLKFLPGAVPVASMGIGTVEIHMIDLLSAYGAIANGGVLMPRQVIREIRDRNGEVIYSLDPETTTGSRVASPQASYIITNILEGNTLKNANPIWARWAITDGGKHRPAAYKTGTTDDRKDIDAFGYVAPPKNLDLPALAVGVWLGNSDASAPRVVTSVAGPAPLWSHIMREITTGMPIESFKRPDGLVDVTIDAFSGQLPGPGTVKTVKEIFIEGTEPKGRDNLHVEQQIDLATGLLWQDGCTGPMESRWFLDFSRVEPNFPQWQAYTQEWASRAARGVGVAGGPKRTRTAYFAGFGFYPYGRTWGGAFAPTEVCQAVVPPTCPPGNGQGKKSPEPCITPEPTGPLPSLPIDPRPTRTPRTTAPLPTLVPSVPGLTGPPPTQAAILGPALPASLVITLIGLLAMRGSRRRR